jgi:hypothetical protein
VWSNDAFVQAPRTTEMEPAKLADLRSKLRDHLAALR